MSVRVMAAAWALDIPSTEKLVLLALADWSNDDGICWPSIAQLCTKSGLSERAVRKCISRMCEAGHLSREETCGKGVTYTVKPSGVEATPARRAPGTKSPRHVVPPAPDAGTPAPRAPNTPVTTISSDASHPQSLRESFAKEEDEEELPDDRPTEDEVVEAFNEVATACHLPSVRTPLSRERRRRLRARIRDHPMDDWRDVLAAIRRSPFLRGETGNWRGATFDFVLQPSSFLKILEGNYDRPA